MDEELETEEVTVTGPQMVSHQTLGVHQIQDQDIVVGTSVVSEPDTEIITVTATEKPEDVVKALMSEEKKQELVARLQLLKSTLDDLESKKIQLLEEQVKPKEKMSGEQMFNRAELLTLINNDIRANIITFVNSDRYDAFKDALEVLAQSTKIYEEIVEQLLE